MVSPMTHRCFHVTCSHMLLCVPTRKSARSTIKIACLVSSHTQQCDCSLTHTETHIRFGRMCTISVSALGPDSMLCQHIFDVNSCHSCLLLLFCTLFPWICLPLTDRPNFTPFQNVEYWTNRDPFYEPIPRENITQNFNIILNQNGTFVEFMLFSLLPKTGSRPP